MLPVMPVYHVLQFPFPMRQSGTLTEWDDDKGFGFINMTQGGDAFVHISAFGIRARRPRSGDVISFELSEGDEKRPRAVKVRLTGSGNVTAASGNAPLRIGVGIAVVFYAALAYAVMSGLLDYYVGLLYLGTGCVTFLMYATDKHAARRGLWRISEARLHLFELVGGWPTALLAQRFLRHKCSKLRYQIAFWFVVLLNFNALCYYTVTYGAPHAERNRAALMAVWKELIAFLSDLAR